MAKAGVEGSANLSGGIEFRGKGKMMSRMRISDWEVLIDAAFDQPGKLTMGRARDLDGTFECEIELTRD